VQCSDVSTAIYPMYLKDYTVVVGDDGDVAGVLEFMSA
jgi:hypothetical protein